MNLFHHKSPYTQEQINQQVTNLERLHKLRDMCRQKEILADNDHSGSITAGLKWSMEAERYSRNIESGQRMLDFMQTKNVGKG